MAYTLQKKKVRFGMKKMVFILAAAMMSASISSSAFAQTADTRSAALKFQEGHLKAELTWVSPAPVTGPESKLQVQWLNENDEPVDIDGDFKVLLWMPAMGHGSSPTKVGKQSGVGSYLVNKIYFTMPGEWEVRLTLRLKDQNPETQALPVIAPEP